MELLTIHDVARVLRVSTRTVREYVSRGLLRPVRVGPRLVRFMPREIERFISGAPVEPPTTGRARRRKEGA